VGTYRVRYDDDYKEEQEEEGATLAGLLNSLAQ
jgi:hypothetical protein